jgi:hypothetical protein
MTTHFDVVGISFPNLPSSLSSFLIFLLSVRVGTYSKFQQSQDFVVSTHVQYTFFLCNVYIIFSLFL